MTTNSKGLVTVLAILVTSSCTSVGPNYPAKWGKRAVSESGKYCDISGSYNAIGEANPENPKPEWLTEPYKLHDVIFPTFWFAEVTNVAIHQKDAKSVKIVLWNAERKVFEKELWEDKDEIQCSENYIRLSHSRESSPADYEFGFPTSKKTISYLHKTETGDLSVNVKDVQAGVGFILVPVPLGYEGSYWYLFKRRD